MIRREKREWIAAFLASWLSVFILDSARGLTLGESILWSLFAAVVAIGILLGLRKMVV